MAAVEMCEQFQRVMTLLPHELSVESLTAAIADVAQLESVLAALRTRLLADLASLSPAAESLYAGAVHVSLGQANRVLERASTLASIRPIDTAFASGLWSVAHVDAFVAIYQRATADVRAQLAECLDDIVTFGSSSTPNELRQHAADLARQFEGAEDAEERLNRQKKATRLSMRIDQKSGMGKVSGQFDPELFQILHGLVLKETQARFYDLTPEFCPLDPLDRQQFLRAHALMGLLTGTGAAVAGGGPEIIVVHHRPNTEVTVDWGLAGLELPDSSLDRILANRARIFNIVIRNGDIVSAPGDLNLGRRYRLANRAQRRALAAVHSTCSVPGCEVRYWQTKLHHILEWERGGLTDLNNLIPLCSRHHARLHTEKWGCQLQVGRRIVFTLPDGTVLANAPPLAAAA
jgi:hypothetical protein